MVRSQGSSWMVSTLGAGSSFSGLIRPASKAQPRVLILPRIPEGWLEDPLGLASGSGVLTVLRGEALLVRGRGTSGTGPADRSFRSEGVTLRLIRTFRFREDPEVVGLLGSTGTVDEGAPGWCNGTGAATGGPMTGGSSTG